MEHPSEIIRYAEHLLDVAMRQSSEPLLIEYRRRRDLAKGTLTQMHQVWLDIDAMRSRSEKSLHVTRLPVGMGLVLAGLAACWLATGRDGESLAMIAGGLFVVAGSILCGVYAIERSKKKTQLEGLLNVEALGLGAWCSAGAPEWSYWINRDQHLRAHRAKQQVLSNITLNSLSPEKLIKITRTQGDADGYSIQDHVDEAQIKWLWVCAQLFQAASGGMAVLEKMPSNLTDSLPEDWPRKYGSPL